MAKVKTLAVDAGLDGLGVALFEGDELALAWYSQGPERRRSRDGTLERGPRVWRANANALSWLLADSSTTPDRIVLETMKVYAGRQGFGKDAADLLELNGVVGCVAATFPGADVGGVLARDWKGQVPKRIMLERIRGWIVARGWGDRVLIPKSKPSLVHNAIDAAGLGMVALGIEGKAIYSPWS